MSDQTGVQNAICERSRGPTIDHRGPGGPGGHPDCADACNRR